jgi:hypothetical protein
MSWVVRPEPHEAEERSALLRVVERALAEEEAGPPAHASRWWRSGLDDLGGGPARREPWRQPGVAEP